MALHGSLQNVETIFHLRDHIHFWASLTALAAWVIYLCGGRRSPRFSFSLWFPMTWLAILGFWLLVWGFLRSPPASSANGAAFDNLLEAIAILCLLPTPFILATNIWLRPPNEALRFWRIVPIVLICMAAWQAEWVIKVLCARPLQIVVLDVEKHPISGAEVILAGGGFHAHPTRTTGRDGTASFWVLPFESINGEVHRGTYSYAWFEVNCSTTGLPWGSWNRTLDIVRVRSWYRENTTNVMMPLPRAFVTRLELFLPQSISEFPDYGPTAWRAPRDW